MLLSSVVLILQETLEAALLMSILAALSLHLERRLNWFSYGLVAGLLLAFTYAANLQAVSESFDYVGQEILNATLQALVAVLVVVLVWCASALAKHPSLRAPGRLFALCAGAAVALSICREGSEILIYLDGFLAQETRTQAVLLGALIGVGIGTSVGLLLFYGLWGLSRRRSLVLTICLLALFAGNMLSQASVELAQADLLAGGGLVWDTSGWLPEQSIPGHLLYALVGYEATPSFSQVLCYAIGVILALLSAALGDRVGSRDAAV
jgi:high-affinity iron transporter